MIWYDIAEESLIIKDTYYKDPYGRCLYWQCCYYKIPLKTSSGEILIPGAICLDSLKDTFGISSPSKFWLMTVTS